ncbi:MAG: endonuclease/exonuclease/phosphatase (EEP) superfamily protein YafD [Bacteriovoracaceae bacterium]|jgi:endonuclease/exonuclease/phosphatase (EEP) superfamily protein YafD
MLKKNIMALLLATLFSQASMAQNFGGDIWDSLNIFVPKHKDIMTTIGEPNRSKLDPENIKILVWNMYKGQNESWQNDFKSLAEDRDILLLQEMYLDEKMMSSFEEDADHQYHLATSFIYRKGQIRTGVTSASKIKASNVFYQQSVVREPVINTPKMVLFTTYPIAGSDKDLLTINIHAINFVSTEGLARQIKDVEEVMQTYDGPIVFAGDFNTWSPGKFNFVRMMAVRNNLKEVKFSNDQRMIKFGLPLDYVFYRGLELKSETVWGELEGADHKAMEVVFKVN